FDQSDHREERSQRDRDDRKHTRKPALERRPRDSCDERREGEQEEREQPPTLREILRPEQRQRGQREERPGRDGETSGERVRLLAASKPPDERPAGCRQYDVERQQAAELALGRDREEEAVVRVHVQ